MTDTPSLPRPEGRESFRFGKTLIRVTEHFPENGRSPEDILRELILRAARQPDHGT